MVSSDTIRTIVGIIGNIISFCLFLSPVPTFVRICKMKSVEQFKPDPYIATVLNCMMWIFYGMPFVHPDSTLVLTINGIGLAMQLTYVSIFLIYSPTWAKRRKILLIMLGEVLFVMVVVLITLLCFHTTKKRSMVVGIVCIVFNIAMYTSPLTVMQRVIKTKSVRYMPFFFSLANFCNGIVWSIYAVLKFDPYILVPNGLGAFSGLVQLILYATYYKTTNWNEQDKPSELELPDSGYPNRQTNPHGNA